MKLIDQAHKNLFILRELKPDDILLSRRFVLQKQDEYVQPDNISDLEGAIYFTYHQLFLSFNEYKYPPKKVYDKMEESVDNIYENKQLQEMLKDEQFKEVMDDIEFKLSYISERNYFKSQLYPVYSAMSSVQSIFYKFCKEFDTMRMVREYQKNFLREDITDDEEEEDEDEEEKIEDVEKEEVEEEEKVEEKEEEVEEVEEGGEETNDKKEK
tara:strand:+ start:485 stop:1120 length:636 start_codon:yes stop_codon:yes gene_type:complete